VRLMRVPPPHHSGKTAEPSFSCHQPSV